MDGMQLAIAAPVRIVTDKRRVIPKKRIEDRKEG